MDNGENSLINSDIDDSFASIDDTFIEEEVQKHLNS